MLLLMIIFISLLGVVHDIIFSSCFIVEWYVVHVTSANEVIRGGRYSVLLRSVEGDSGGSKREAVTLCGRERI
jgi:hypothetical protein